MSKKERQQGPLAAVHAVQAFNRPPTLARALQQLSDQNRPPAFARVLQELNKQNREEREKSFRALNPSVAEQVRAAVNSISGGDQLRAAARMNVSGNAARIINESLAEGRLNTGRMINESLAQRRLDSRRLFADVTKGITLSHALRETLSTIKGSQIGVDLKLAATGVLAEQAALARLRIPRQRLLGFASEAQWQGFRKSFAEEAAKALSIAGLNAGRELKRLREEALRDRELAREALRSVAAQASVHHDPAAGLEDVPELLQELIWEMHSLAAAIRTLRSNARVQYLGLLLALIMAIYQIAWDQLEQPSNPRTPPAPLVDIEVHVNERPERGKQQQATAEPERRKGSTRSKSSTRSKNSTSKAKR